MDELAKGIITGRCFFCGSITWTCNDGIFKQRVHKFHSIGTKAALGNCLPYILATANKLPETSVLTQPAGGKEINFNERG